MGDFSCKLKSDFPPTQIISAGSYKSCTKEKGITCIVLGINVYNRAVIYLLYTLSSSYPLFNPQSQTLHLSALPSPGLLTALITLYYSPRAFMVTVAYKCICPFFDGCYSCTICTLHNILTSSVWCCLTCLSLPSYHMNLRTTEMVRLTIKKLYGSIQCLSNSACICTD